MKLFTQEIIEKFNGSPLYSKDGIKKEDVEVICKIFNPFGAGTWYITECDWDKKLAFGLCCIHENELGYVSLKELENIDYLERDLYWTGTLADAMRIEGKRR